MQTDRHVERVDRYYSFILGCSPQQHSEGGLSACESERRLECEEGYGSRWPVLILKRQGDWHVSAAPALLGQILPVVQGAQGQGGFSTELRAGIQDLIAKRLRGKLVRSFHTLCLLPPNELPVQGPPPGLLVRPMALAEKPTNRVPAESVKLGTAFGVFDGAALVSWAEATPLPIVTPRFGILLVGIETTEGYRRRGCARAALSALTGRALAMELTPLYACSVTNVASLRTALSCGYRLHAEILRLQVEE